MINFITFHHGRHSAILHIARLGNMTSLLAQSNCMVVLTPQAEPKVKCSIQSTQLKISDNALIVTHDSQGNCIAEQSISSEGQWNISVALSYANRIGSKNLLVHAKKGNEADYDKYLICRIN